MSFVLFTCWKFSKVQGGRCDENLDLGAVVSGSVNFWLTQSHAFDSDQMLACCFTSVELSRSHDTGEKELTWHKTCRYKVLSRFESPARI